MFFKHTFFKWLGIASILALGLLGCQNALSTKDQVATIEAMPTRDPRNFDDSASWSPDGKSIVFGSGRSGNGDIWTIGVDGTGLKNLTADSIADDSNAQWSPDGCYILFISDRTEKYDLWRMDADGTNPTRLKTPDEKISFDFSWSPDSQRIVFIGVENDREDIWIINADGSGATNLTANTTYSYLRPSWSPDGQSIAAITAILSPFHSGLVLIAIDSKRQVELIKPATNPMLLFAVMSPLGDQIAFSRQVTTPATYADLWTINSDGSGEQNLTNTEREIESSLWWSPDGQYILFACNVPDSNEICRADADGSNRIQLTQDGKAGGVSGNVGPSWSPDGQRIAYVKLRDTESSLWLMDADGSNQMNLSGQQ